MKGFLLIGLFVPLLAWADIIEFTSPKGSLELTTEPCTDEKVLAHLSRGLRDPVLVPRFRASILMWEGKRYESCSIVLGGLVYTIDEQGAPLQPPIPRHLFKPQI